MTDVNVHHRCITGIHILDRYTSEISIHLGYRSSTGVGLILGYPLRVLASTMNIPNTDPNLNNDPECTMDIPDRRPSWM